MMYNPGMQPMDPMMPPYNPQMGGYPGGPNPFMPPNPYMMPP